MNQGTTNTPLPASDHRSDDWKFAVILAALGALGPFSVDTFFPSFPAIGQHFSVSQNQVQSTLSFYLTSLAFMNLFHGALSDSFGRRRIILFFLGVYVVTAFMCPFAPNFTSLLVLRVIQGLAGGVGMIVGRAIIRDRFHGSNAQKLMAEVTMVSSMAPAVAPILGGWLHACFGWQGPFAFLGLLGFAAFLGCYFGLPETLPVELRQSFHPTPLTRSYWQTIREPKFLALCLSVGFAGGGFLIYVASAPDVVRNILHLSETQFGWLFVPMVSGFVLGSFLASRMAGRVHPNRALAIGFSLMTAGAAANLIYNVFSAPKIPWAVLPLAFYTFGFCIYAPIITILCLDLFPHKKGMVSSLQGFVQILIFALISSGITPLVYKSGIKHAMGMVAMLLLSWLGWAFFKTRK